MITDRYYYNHLGDKEKRIYSELYKGIIGFQSIVKIKSGIVSVDTVKRITEAITKDNPQMYYFDNSLVQVRTSVAKSEVMLNYSFSKAECQTINKTVETSVNSIITNLRISSVTDEFEREKLIHDALAKQVSYDHEAVKTSDKRHLATAHSIVGVFLAKKAVCEGIAKAMKILLNTININCIVVTGKADIENEIGHAWNVVRINGEAYHLDATWDIANSSRNAICYDYFNLPENEIAQDHRDYIDIPYCNQIGANYFYRKGLRFPDLRTAIKYAKSSLNEKNNHLYIAFEPNSVDLAKSANELVKVGLDLLSSDGYHWTATYYINEAQNIIRIDFNVRV